MLRISLGALIGFGLWTVLWLSYNAALVKIGLVSSTDSNAMEPPRTLLIILCGSLVFSLLAGYVAALVAAADGYLAAGVLSVALVAVGVVVQSQVWRKMPIWYHASFLLLLAPLTLVGAWLRLQ